MHLQSQLSGRECNLMGKGRDLHAETDSPFAEVLLDVGAARLRARITRASVGELGLAPGQQVYALVKTKVGGQ